MRFSCLVGLSVQIGCIAASTLWADTTAALPRSAPEAQGVSSKTVLAFIEAADQQIEVMNSFMLVRHGHVVAEGWWKPYEPGSNHELYSLSKSFTSTAVGLAISEGKLNLDDEVVQIFPGEAPAEPSANLKAMRIRDLLCMSTGHQDEPSAAADKASPKTFLAQPVPHKPGTHFKYNTAATFMLSAIIQKQTGQTVLDYLRPRLFAPLGITQPVWATNLEGVSLGGYGLRVRTEDIAKFGQLYLQRGRWHGKQLVPATWVETAISRQTSNGSNPKSDWDQGYGYQFWRCRHGAYRGDGAFGQFCVVLPEQDAVIVITSGVKDMQSVLNLIWDKLLPAFQPAKLPADSGNRKKLADKLGNLSLRAAEGSSSSPLLPKLVGRRFRFHENAQKLESIALIRDGSREGLVLVTGMNGTDHRLSIGFSQWAHGRGPFLSLPDEPLAASGAWKMDDTLLVKICAYETPFYATIRLRFQGDEVVVSRETNVGFGELKQTDLTATAEQ